MRIATRAALLARQLAGVRQPTARDSRTLARIGREIADGIAAGIEGRATPSDYVPPVRPSYPRDPSTCDHRRVEPVGRGFVLPGALVDEHVADLCVDCGAQLDAGWWCEDCDWIDDVDAQTFAEPRPPRVRVRPCEQHEDAHRW